MAVHRPQIAEAHFLKEGSRHQHRAYAVLDLVGSLQHPVANAGNAGENLFHIMLGLLVLRHQPYAGEIFAHGSHILVDRHLIVVQNDNEILAQFSRMVQSLEGFAAREGTIAYHRNDLIAAATQIPGNRHAQSSGNGGAGMANTEGIIR